MLEEIRKSEILQNKAFEEEHNWGIKEITAKKDAFAVLSIILILCCIDQFCMIQKYHNISWETFGLTVFFTILNIYFAFIKK